MTTQGFVGYLGITFFPGTGFWITPFAERTQTSIAVRDTATNGGGLQLNWFPLPPLGDRRHGTFPGPRRRQHRHDCVALPPLLPMKTSGIIFMVVGLGLGLASCAPPAVPQRPSWDEDVFPILQGSCNHCHGETVGNCRPSRLARLDICDPTPFADAGITGPRIRRGQAGGRAVPRAISSRWRERTRANMPPPPAAELSDYERDVLLKWGASNRHATSATSRAATASPTCGSSTTVWDGNDLKLTVEVWDPDQDQVLGKVTVGAASAVIVASGRREVVVTGANENDRITVLLHDGYVSRTIDNL